MNVGSEDDKGTDLTRATRALFQSSPLADRFVGNVEGRDIYEGHARVVVCEGFVGNVLLKAGEGAVEFLFATLKEEMARLLPGLAARGGRDDRREPQGAQDPVRVRGVRRRPPAGHPRRLHHLPRLLRRPRHQERPPRRRHHGRGPDQHPDRRATGRRATRRSEWRVVSGELRDRASALALVTPRLAHTSLATRPLPSEVAPCRKSPSSSPARGRRPWAWGGSSTRNCRRPAPCSTARARSSASTSGGSASRARPRRWRRPTSASRPSSWPAWRRWRA